MVRLSPHEHAPRDANFFFSSRRRHTRCSRDWSSDVCSSDLLLDLPQFRGHGLSSMTRLVLRGTAVAEEGMPPPLVVEPRSEERRVGKECRTRGAEDYGEKKKG